MDAGTYVFTGNLDLTGGGALNGTGVTLYFAAPNGQLGGPGNGNTTLNLTVSNQRHLSRHPDLPGPE